MGPHPAVAAIRLAVRRALADLVAETGTAFTAPTAVPVPGAATATATATATVLIGNARRHPSGLPRTPAAPGSPLVLVAVSGGADSMALATATAFEAPKLGLRVGAVTIDHGLQAGSAERAQQVVERLRALGLDPVEAVPVRVGRQGGPEGAARDARYAALDEAAERHQALAVFLGHTRDDQAETVLLGLARGSGARSLAGMPAARRAATAARCWTSTARPPGRRAPRSPSRSGTTRTTWTPPTPAPGCATRCCRCWRSTWAAAWCRRWPAPPGSSGTTPTPSTSGPRWSRRTSPDVICTTVDEPWTP